MRIQIWAWLRSNHHNRILLTKKEPNEKEKVKKSVGESFHCIPRSHFHQFVYYSFVFVRGADPFDIMHWGCSVCVCVCIYSSPHYSFSFIDVTAYTNFLLYIPTFWLKYIRKVPWSPLLKLYHHHHEFFITIVTNQVGS